MAKNKADQIRDRLLETREVAAPIETKNLLSSGSTLVNLQCSGKTKGAFPKGKYIHMPGDSDAGKSIMGITALAEACIDKNFEEYELVYDAAEDGMDIDVESMFSERVARRITGPLRGNSGNLEDFYINLRRHFDSGVPFIYVLDSMDSLYTGTEEEKYADQDEARIKGKEISGSYQVDKPKYNSSRLREAKVRLKEKGSILIIISQTRDKLPVPGVWTPPGPPQKVYSGGYALKFYALLQLWLSPQSDIQKDILTKKRQLGIQARVAVKKNHLTGRKGSVSFPIYWSHGIDDVGSCVDYLVDEGVWVKSGKIDTGDLGINGTREEVIRAVEANGVQRDLRIAVSKRWKEVEAACTVERTNRYA